MSETIEKLGEKPDTLMAHQLRLEKLYSNNQLLPRIRAEFETCTNPDFVAWLTDEEIPVAFGIDLLAQISLHKRADLPTLVGILFHHFNDAQKTADMLLAAAEAELIDWSPIAEKFIQKPGFQVDDETQLELDKFQYPLPMVVEPGPIRTNRDTGYLLGSGSVILKNNHHDDDVCLDHLNRVNRIRLTVSERVVKMIHNRWKNLDHCKEGETKEEFDKRKQAFIKYDRTARDVMNLLMQESDHFYLTHAVDKRGRTYCRGYHISTQGNDWNKASIEFADKELLDE